MKNIGNFFLGLFASIFRILKSPFHLGVTLLVLVGLVQSVSVPTHVEAILKLGYNPEGNLRGLFLFLICGGSMLMLFSLANYYKKQTLKGVIVITLITAVVVYATVSYLLIVKSELAYPGNVFSMETPEIKKSVYLMIAMAGLSVVGNVLLIAHKIFGTPIER